MKGQRRDACCPSCTPPRNALTKMKMSETQVRPIKNNVSKPKATGYKKVKGAVSG